MAWEFLRMMRFWRLLAGWGVAFMLIIAPSMAQTPGGSTSAHAVTGVNLGYVPDAASQAGVIEQLKTAGIKMLRLGLQDQNAAPFMIAAARRGIQTIALLNTALGSHATAGCPRPTIGQSYGAPCLSNADPAGFKAVITPQLDALEASGVRLAAIEVGNELNWYFSNGDLPPAGTGRNGTGRVLGFDALTNPGDAEGRKVAAGYLAYLRIVAVVKDWRDSSRLNRQTPLLSLGLLDPGPPSEAAYTWKNVDAVTIGASLRFLRDHGLDRLVDGYSIHFYPKKDGSAATVSDRVSELEKDAFAMCSQAKPCWLTEWGVRAQITPCPVGDGASVDTGNVHVVTVLREALRHFVGRHRLVAAIYYDWSSPTLTVPPNSFPIFGIFPSCVSGGKASVTRSGRMAIAPL